MEYILKDRQPALPLKYFEDISAIPRGSYNEAAVAAFIAERAKELGLYVRVDEKNNVVVKKPGSKGCEDLPALLMQGHLDMVCEKNADTVHDFKKDGIKLVVDGNILKADGTTLGADCGRGVAYMLALMDKDSDTFPHPPLEFLFTTGEEVGFWGAVDLDCSDITARRMIGTDAGPEGVMCITSAGGQEVELSVATDFKAIDEEGLEITVNGLLGGHSAMAITSERGNANKIMGRILHNVAKVAHFHLCDIDGGLMFNAIPREAKAVIALRDKDKEAATEMINKVFAEVKEELAFSDKDVCVTVKPVHVTKMLSPKTTTTIVESIYNIPNGVKMMNMAIRGLPVTSTNMGVVKTHEDKVTVNTMLRSSSKTLNDEYADNIISVGKMAGMTDVRMGNWLAAWPYMAQSKMRDLANEMYKEETGRPMKEFAVHGGLELGLFSEKMPGMDIVTLGPTSGDAHTVTEWLDLDSYARVYEFIKRFIERLTK